jgi:hypothetical protein
MVGENAGYADNYGSDQEDEAEDRDHDGLRWLP